MNTLSAPVPRNFREIDDRFVTVVLGAPKFEMLQKSVNYSITPEMMLGTLREGIKSIATRSRSTDAQSLYAESIKALDAACSAYSASRELEGKSFVMQAHNIFLSAAKRKPQWNA